MGSSSNRFCITSSLWGIFSLFRSSSRTSSKTGFGSIYANKIIQNDISKEVKLLTKKKNYLSQKLCTLQMIHSFTELFDIQGHLRNIWVDGNMSRKKIRWDSRWFEKVSCKLAFGCHYKTCVTCNKFIEITGI